MLIAIQFRWRLCTGLSTARSGLAFVSRRNKTRISWADATRDGQHVVKATMEQQKTFDYTKSANTTSWKRKWLPTTTFQTWKTICVRVVEIERRSPARWPKEGPACKQTVVKLFKLCVQTPSYTRTCEWRQRHSDTFEWKSDENREWRGGSGCSQIKVRSCLFFSLGSTLYAPSFTSGWQFVTGWLKKMYSKMYTD